jgi:fumarylacetoacetase
VAPVRHPMQSFLTAYCDLLVSSSFFCACNTYTLQFGTMFRGPVMPCSGPNCLHLPVGWTLQHGLCYRYSSASTHGTAPKTRTMKLPAVIHGPLNPTLGFQIEVAVVGGQRAIPRTTLSRSQTKRLFGFCSPNGGAPRHSKWEYVPLGPFTSKNFAHDCFAWIVVSTALRAFVDPVAGQQVEPTHLYHAKIQVRLVHVELTVGIPGGSRDGATTISRSTLRILYWNACSVGYHSVSGCIMRGREIYWSSGTISGSSGCFGVCWN